MTLAKSLVPTGFNGLGYNVYADIAEGHKLLDTTLDFTGSSNLLLLARRQVKATSL